MNYKGMVLTGTSGAGKTQIARLLCELSDDFEKCKLLTTRPSREDDSGDYEYISEEEFLEKKAADLFLTDIKYRQEYYGILKDSIKVIIQTNKKIPILTISPEAQKKLFEQSQGTNNDYLSFFIDADNSTLERRLASRDGYIPPDSSAQRESDRGLSSFTIYSLKNDGNINDIVQLIFELWQYRYSGGLLPKKLISLFIKCGSLLTNAKMSKIEGASYDLSLGEQFVQNGNIETLIDTRPFIILKPGDYAIVTSKEIANLPNDIAARYDITVGLFAQGLILSNGPQVDPGFKGSLLCLLFNTSNQEISLKRDAHYATIEFIKLLEPTTPYSGPHQNQEQIGQYFSRFPGIGEIVKMRSEINELKDYNLKYSKLPTIAAVISLIIAVIAMVMVLYTK